MENTNVSLMESFQDFFSVKLATTPEEIAAAQRVRYRVYCQENTFEPADLFPNGLEYDEFDLHSLHLLITHKRSGESAGCVRLVLAGEEELLPMERYCMGTVYTDYLTDLSKARDQVAEFSRLAVDPAFRKRTGEGHTILGEFDAMDCCHRERRSFSLVGVATSLSAFALAEMSGRVDVFAMMDPYLPRMLRRSGILVQQAGDYMEYHGSRAPYYINAHSAISNMHADVRTFYDNLHSALSRDYAILKRVA